MTIRYSSHWIFYIFPRRYPGNGSHNNVESSASVFKFSPASDCLMATTSGHLLLVMSIYCRLATLASDSEFVYLVCLSIGFWFPYNSLGMGPIMDNASNNSSIVTCLSVVAVTFLVSVETCLQSHSVAIDVFSCSSILVFSGHVTIF